jgi:hypothetical protein
MENSKKKVSREDKPTSIRLGVLKPILHEESLRLDRSIHWLMIEGLKMYVKTFKK